MKNKAPFHNHQASRHEVLTAEEWFAQQGWEVFDFQRQCWDAVADGRSGLLQAPTGSGKTYALFLSLHSDAYRASHVDIGSGKLKVLWITPLRALSADIAMAIDQACKGMGVEWDVGVRTSDTPQALKTRQLRTMPEVLVITPESLHVLFSYPDAERLFSDLSLVVVDEWHELLGSKRGVQTELAIAHL
ncbi:MAG: DEAD/DEAH box helicase, partial [Bradyrhizobiaceae bacterium]|nr:DEAD/DEAH box helicase [Bradyrhizobiaceae bacterium]